MCLKARVYVKPAGKLEISEKIELVTLIAVGKAVIQSRLWGEEAKVIEGIALVRVVIQIFRDYVVPLQLEPLAESLSHSDGNTAIKRLAGTVGDKDIAELRAKGPRRDHRRSLRVKQAVGIDIEERRQVHAFGHREIHVSCPAREDFLLVRHVRRIDARIRVVLAEHAHACKAREWIHGRAQGAGRSPRCNGESVWPDRAAAEC